MTVACAADVDTSGRSSTRYRWVVLGVATGAQAIYSVLSMGLPSLAPIIRSTYSLRLDQVGVALSAVLAGQMFTQYVWGVAVDRFGDRRTIVVGLLGAAGASAATAAAGSFTTFAACLFLVGVVGASINISSGRAVAQWFAVRERGLAMGIRQSALPVGGAVGAAVLPPIAFAVGLRGAVLAVAAALVVTAAAAGLWLREPHAERTSRRRAPRAGRDRATMLMIAAGGLLCIPQFGVVTFAALYLHDEAGVAVSAAALALGTMQALGAVGRIGVGIWSDRTGVRIRPLRTLALAIAVADLVVAACVGSGAAVMATVLVVAGVLALAWNALIPAVLVEFVGPERVGRAIGLLTTVQAVTATATPPLFALLVSATSYRLGFALLAPAGLLAHRLLRQGRAAEVLTASAAATPARSTA